MFITARNECENSPPNNQYTKYVCSQKKTRYQTLHGAIGGGRPYASPGSATAPVGSGAKPQSIEPKMLVV